MTLQPATAAELADSLRTAFASGTRISRFDLCALNRVVDFVPEDMTVSVEAGMTLAGLQSELARRGQWLPVDPPHPERLSVGALLATNASGPRRYGFGSIRDWLIGINVVLPDGRMIKAGGRVVKNVAGYDLGKLFIGSRGSLGVIVAATFKIRPLSEAEQFIQVRCGSLADAAARIDKVVGSEITPVVLDLHRLSTLEAAQSPVLVLGFSGTREEVEWQLEEARCLGIDEAARLDHDTEFWNGGIEPHRVSVLPSALVRRIDRLGNVPFVARAGNGMIYYRGRAEPPKDPGPLRLIERLKAEFDPKRILPDPPR